MKKIKKSVQKKKKYIHIHMLMKVIFQNEKSIDIELKSIFNTF